MKTLLTVLTASLRASHFKAIQGGDALKSDTVQFKQWTELHRGPLWLYLQLLYH